MKITSVHLKLSLRLPVIELRLSFVYSSLPAAKWGYSASYFSTTLVKKIVMKTPIHWLSASWVVVPVKGVYFAAKNSMFYLDVPVDDKEDSDTVSVILFEMIRKKLKFLMTYPYRLTFFCHAMVITAGSESQKEIRMYIRQDGEEKYVWKE